jgi:quercetin dioxygenase-like cupin family protein
MWHIDEFPTLAAARAAATPSSVAFEAHGSTFLSTIESSTSDHHGGTHRGAVGPLPVEQTGAYSSTVMAAYFMPGNFSNVHTHSGPEAWWVLEGEQCLETTHTTVKARAGEGSIVPMGETMRLVATGEAPRKSLVLILHDTNRPATSIVAAPPPLKSCQ